MCRLPRSSRCRWGAGDGLTARQAGQMGSTSQNSVRMALRGWLLHGPYLSDGSLGITSAEALGLALSRAGRWSKGSADQSGLAAFSGPDAEVLEPSRPGCGPCPYTPAENLLVHEVRTLLTWVFSSPFFAASV